MSTVTLQVSHLKAALICAATRDIRYYLNAVVLEVRKRDALLVATDGHRLCVIHAATVPEGEPDNVPVQIIIPRDTLKGIKPMRKCVATFLEYDPAQPLAECRLSGLEGGDRVFKPIDARYPDWRRVVPDTLSGERAVFNPVYVAEFLEVAQIISGKGNTYVVNVHENGNGSATITSSAAPEFLGVLMPMRGENAEYSRPAWLDEAREEQPQALAA